MACQAARLRSLVLGTLAMDQGDATAAERWLLSIMAADGAGTGPDGQQRPDRAVLAAALGSLGPLYVHQGRLPGAGGPAVGARRLVRAGPGRGNTARRSCRARPAGPEAARDR